MEGKPPLALWFSHTGIIAYPPHRTQYLFSTPNTPLYSEITPIIKTKEDGTLTYLVSGLEYTNAIFVRYGSIVCVHLHGTCPYKLGENIYAKITDPVFIPGREITAIAAFASGTAKNGTSILKIKQDGSVNIIATEEGLNWIFADIFYVV